MVMLGDHAASRSLLGSWSPDVVEAVAAVAAGAAGAAASRAATAAVAAASTGIVRALTWNIVRLSLGR
jgi:hypothetical protein